MRNISIYTKRLLVVWSMLLILVAGFVGGYFFHRPETVVETEIVEVKVLDKVVQPQLGREAVTQWLRDSRVTGGYMEAAKFYNGYVNDMDLTFLILSAAEMYEVPINTLFALISAESGFNPKAVNGTRNKNGTNDKGLMQLNSAYFKGFDRLDSRLNLQYGCNHLKNRFDKYGSWDEAVMYYNGFSQGAVDHQSKVLATERELDGAFHLWRCTYELQEES